MKIMNEVSYLGPHVDDTTTLALDDPELGSTPVAYIIEVAGVDDRSRGAALLAYLRRRIHHRRRLQGAGSAAASRLDPFEANMKRAMRKLVSSISVLSHPHLPQLLRDQIAGLPQAYLAGRATFRGLYEDNDPTKRLQ